jgi:hypothetical protein
MFNRLIRYFAFTTIGMMMFFPGSVSADVFLDTVDGAIDGAIVGGIVGGRDGAAAGAVVGGVAGYGYGVAREEERYYRYERRRWEYERQREMDYMRYRRHERW